MFFFLRLFCEMFKSLHYCYCWSTHFTGIVRTQKSALFFHWWELLWLGEFFRWGSFCAI